MAVIQDLKMILSNATTTCITNARTYTEEIARYRAVVDYVNQLEEIPIIHGKAELELHDQAIRNQAITEFAERLKDELLIGLSSRIPPISLKDIDEIAEEMKGRCNRWID